MIVLGLDTATSATAVGLRLADGTTLQTRDEPAAGERPGHTTHSLPLAAELLAGAGLRWDAIERIAVGVGPGTFTGLRVGVAIARGLAQSLGVDVVGISTPRILAEAALRAHRTPGSHAAKGVAAASGPRPGVLAVIDARRGEAFVAAYGAQSEPPVQDSSPRTPPDPPLEAAPDLPARHAPDAGSAPPALGYELAIAGRPAPWVLAPRDLGGIVAALDAQRHWLAVGDGAVRFRVQLEAVGVAVPADASPLHRVDAGVLCELALAAPRGSHEAVLPDYRRRPDAEIALRKAQPSTARPSAEITPKERPAATAQLPSGTPLEEPQQ